MSDDSAPATTIPDDAARAAALEARIAEIEATTRAQVIRAELKAEAIRAGMIDLDGLKLVDTSAVSIDGKGEVSGAAAVMAALRRDKPWLFGGTNSSSTAAPPPAMAPRAKLATEMSYAEWQAARREMIRRR
jgi:hypothetical protein